MMMTIMTMIMITMTNNTAEHYAPLCLYKGEKITKKYLTYYSGDVIINLLERKFFFLCGKKRDGTTDGGVKNESKDYIGMQ